MIRTALYFIRKELESYIVERERDASYTYGGVVELKSYVLPDGSLNISDTSHISMMLVGVEEERRIGKMPYYVPADENKYYMYNPPVEIDLLVLFIAHNRDYETSLRDLSDVIGFFQANPVFDKEKYPLINASVNNPESKTWQLVERLSFSLNNMSYDQQNNLWGMIGAKYMPSVVYRIRMLTIFDTSNKKQYHSAGEMSIPKH